MRLKLNSLSLHGLRSLTGSLKPSLLGTLFMSSLLLSGCGGGSSSSSVQVQNNDTTVKLAFDLAAVNVASSDLVAHYNFDQNVGTDIVDMSGNAFDGVAMPWDDAEQAGTVWGVGQYGSALIFSEGGRVTIDSNASLDTALGQNGLSISLWFKLTVTTVNGYVRLVSKKPEWTQDEGFELDFNPTARQIHLVCQGANFIEGIVPEAAIDNNWHHVVATLDGVSGSIRFDGQDITSIDSVPLPGILSCPHQLTIGALANGSAEPVAPFQGAIDDLRLYGRALTVSEQQQLYVDTQNTTNTNKLIAWWTADDLGTTIIDSSGYGHDGLATHMTANAGFIGGSLLGADEDARVNVGGANTLALQGSMSISAWVQVTDDNQDYYMRIVSKKVADADLGGYEFAYYPLDNKLIFNGQGGMSAMVITDLGTGWNLVTVTVDGLAVSFYRNGQLIGTGAIAGLLQSSTPVYLGHRAREDASLPGAWLGSLDDIRMYNYALDASAVASIYAETLRSPENPGSSYAGLLYEYYEGAWSQLPDFDLETLVSTNVVSNFSLSPRLSDSDFGFRYTGYVEVLEHGEYTFFTESDEGSQLYIGNTLVVDNDGLHSVQKNSGTIRLQAGKHAITGVYFERGGDEVMNVTWAGPSFSEMAIPDLQLSRSSNVNFPPILSASIAGNISAAIEGDSVLASVIVTDSEDGTLPDASIVWSSSIDGVLGIGASFDIAALSGGVHLITITATDSLGASSNDTLSLDITALSSLRDADLPSATTAGIDYKYYHGAWSLLPNFAALTPVGAGIIARPDLSVRQQEDNYAFQYTGYLLVPASGVYTFGLNSDDGSRLSFGNTVLIDNDGLHSSLLKTASIGLKSGLHAIDLRFFERTGLAVFDVTWSGPGIATQNIPSSQFFRLDEDAAPVVSILTPSAVSAIKPGVLLSLSGLAFDAVDGSLPNNQWEWSSHLDGVLGNGPALSTDALTEGTHTITLSVSDSGARVGTASVIVVVNGADTGTINREVWLNIGGVRISDLTSNAKYLSTADIEDTLSSFEGPVDWENNYGTRLRGYLYAPVSGAYTFWVSSDDYSEFYLSTDDDSTNKVLTAQVPGWTTSRLWDKYTQQKSISINLVAGQRYYVEALQKEGGGGDSIAVAWEFPGITRSVIDGSFLAPFIPVVNN